MGLKRSVESNGEGSFFGNVIVLLISGANKFAEMYHCKECRRVNVYVGGSEMRVNCCICEYCDVM